MGLINFTQIQDGTTADAADVNTIANTIFDEFNGEIDNANIASDAAISISKIALNSDSTGGVWWEELGRATLGAAGDTITVSSLPARKYLKIIIAALPTGGNINTQVTFNNDTGSNYTHRISDEGTADATATSITKFSLSTAAGPWPIYAQGEVVNIATQEKLVIGHAVGRNSAGAASIPRREEIAAKWVNTSDQITRVDVVNTSTGDFAIGSEVVVLGHN